MKEEHMIPTSYQHAIESHTQRLIGYKSDKITSPSDTRLLVVQYIRELNKQGKFSADKIPNEVKFLKEYKTVINNESADVFADEIQLRDLMFNSNAKDGYVKLCRHIAKARIVADYIASMTDRYAEKKYNEIVSSSTTWS